MLLKTCMCTLLSQNGPTAPDRNQNLPQITQTPITTNTKIKTKKQQKQGLIYLCKLSRLQSTQCSCSRLSSVLVVLLSSEVKISSLKLHILKKPYTHSLKSGLIEIRDKRYKSLMYCHQFYFWW